MRGAAIPARWIALDPKHRFGAEFWLAVRRLVIDAGHQPETASNAVVQAAIRKIDAAATGDAR